MNSKRSCNVSLEVADRVRAVPGGLIGDQQEVLVREQLQQVVQVAEELGGGGVLEDLVQALAAGHIDGAEQPAGGRAAGRRHAGLAADQVVVGAGIRAQAQLGLVLEQQPPALPPQLARAGAFPRASIRRRLLSYSGSGEVTVSLVRPRRNPLRESTA